MTQQEVTQQGDTGCDQSITSLSTIIKNNMTMLRLELVAVILVRNTINQSVFNPVDFLMGEDSISLSAFATRRELATVS